MTTFFNVERSIKSEVSAETDVDLFAWRSTQRVVFTLTNPVDTHYFTVRNFTVNILDKQGNSMEELPPVRFGETVLLTNKTRSIAYEFRVQGADFEEEEEYTFEVTLGFKETEIQQAQKLQIERAFSK